LARRGKAGAVRQPTAGLLMAQFDHYTSRESDPQLHTHCFVLNLAPRRDGSWGAVVSRDLYKAQKTAGVTYRRELANDLERQGHRLDRYKDSFRVAGIPRAVERAFSKRRQAIEAAAQKHGYRTPKGMELAALRTRRPKREAKLEDLRKHWLTEAKALGFELGRDRQHGRGPAAPSSDRSRPAWAADRRDAKAFVRPASVPAPASQQAAAQLGQQLGRALSVLEQPSGMAGLRLKLRDNDRDHARE
jgi:hypothetical protein